MGKNGEEKPFRGYTLEEIEYQRAYLLLQKEFAKAKIIEDVDSLRQIKVFGGRSGKGNAVLKVGSLASKILSGMNYLDYAMIGFSAFGTLRKVFRFFRKK